MSLSDKVKLADLQSNVYDEECEEVFLLEHVKEKVKELKDFIIKEWDVNYRPARILIDKIDEIFGSKLTDSLSARNTNQRNEGASPSTDINSQEVVE